MNQLNHMLPGDFSSWHPAEKRQFLRDNADEIKHDQVRKPLSPDQINDAEKKLAIKALELRKKQAQYDRVKEEWREETIKPLKAEVETLLDTLEEKAELVEDDVFYLRDYENEMVYGLMADGSEVDRRPMLNEEKQQTVQSGMRAVNSDNDNQNE